MGSSPTSATMAIVPDLTIVFILRSRLSLSDDLAGAKGALAQLVEHQVEVLS